MAEFESCCKCKHDNKSKTDFPCNMCIHNATEKFEPKTNFDVCCESIENMAQIIDIAKNGWTKEQIIDWLQSEAQTEKADGKKNFTTLNRRNK